MHAAARACARGMRGGTRFPAAAVHAASQLASARAWPGRTGDSASVVVVGAGARGAQYCVGHYGSGRPHGRYGGTRGADKFG